MHDEMQQGVYLAFFDSVGMFIENRQFETPEDWMYQILAKDIMSPFFAMKDWTFDTPCKSRSEVLTEAFKQANLLYNER